MQSWLGKPKFALEGVIFSYNPDKPEEEEWNKIKNVPSDRILASLEGSWRKQIKYRRKGEKVGLSNHSYSQEVPLFAGSTVI